MKQNNSPMFVKLFVTQKQQIDKKQLISLWGSPHSKDFHIIDNPSVVNRIANQFDNSRRPYSSVKIRTQTSQSIKRQKPLYIVKKTKKNIQRLKFGKLEQQVNCLSDFIENQVNDLKQAEIFQYKQKMLVTFLQDFFHQLQRQCRQKANFIKQIWNQMIQLFDRIFSVQTQNSFNYEKNSLNEIINLHKSYQEMFEKQKKQIKNLQQQSQKQKQLIKSLVINLKQRKKQIKVYQGGINEYNYKINSLNVQFAELKKQHLDILMYGHHGNMTRAQAESMLMTILKPIDEDQQDLRNVVSIKYIPPRLKKGKSDKYLRSPIQRNNNFLCQESKLQDDYYLQNDHIEEQLDVNHYDLKNNFLPKRVKFKNVHRTYDVKVQTDLNIVENQKVSTYVSCNYFEKMDSLIIKNKYCQTQNKKPQRSNASNQTDLTGTQSLFEIKVSKLALIREIFEYKIQNKYCRKSKFLKFNGSQKNLLLQFQGKYSPDLKQLNQLKPCNSNKSSSRQKKFQEQNQKNDNLARLSHKNSSKNLKVQKKKSKIALRNITEQSESVLKTPLRTQNFVRLNKARVSGQLKNMLVDFVDSYNKNIVPECSTLQISFGLLKVYLQSQSFKVNEADKSHQSNFSFISTSINWGRKIFDMIKKIKEYPSNEQMSLSFYYKTKINKNKNIALQNFQYISKIKDFVESLQSKGVSKKKDKVFGSNYTGNFTVKKCYQIIGQVFEVCNKIRNQNKYNNINVIKILQKVLNPSSLRLFKDCIIQNHHQSQQFRKTLQFLSFLIKYVNENYLFKNFLFICGINDKVQVKFRNESGVININKNVNIIEGRQNKKKSMHIDNVIKNQGHEQEQKEIQKRLFGTMTYSSEVKFYFDMLEILNCHKSKQNDLMNFYTTLQVLQTNFQKLSKYYRDLNLINNIKSVIEESIKNYMLDRSKLNVFKCLQIFLQNIRIRKIEMFKSYQEFYDFLAKKQKQNKNKLFLLDILDILKAPQQTQLKIISKFFKYFDNQATFDDFVTLFTIEGFPQFDKIQQNVLNNKNDSRYICYEKEQKINNVVLDYIYQKISKQKVPKLLKNIEYFNKSLVIEKIIDYNVNQILGENICSFEISYIFLNHEEK